MTDTVAIVTGAARGIGAACAARLAAEHHVVVIADLAIGDLEDVAATVRAAGATAVPVVMDVRDEAQVIAATELAGRYGTVRSAVNSAGIGGPQLRAGEHPLDAWQSVIEVNLSGVFLSMREQITLMASTGGGSIVNISSVLGKAAAALAPAYTAAKHAVEGLTKSAALAHAEDGIRVNTVAPGFVDTDLLRNRRTAEDRAALAHRHPLGRLGTAEDVASVVAFLVSPETSFVTGSCYRVDGGYLTRD